MNKNQNNQKKIRSNWLRTELLEAEPDRLTSVGKHSAGTYFELQQIEGNNGVIEKMVEVDYPITADYVKSFLSSTDYKQDLDGALANGVNKPNLGNIVDMQEVYKMDSNAISELAENLKKASEVLKAQKAVQQENIEKVGEANAE